MIRIDKRMIWGPKKFMCYYETLDDKKKLYKWLVQNFGGRMPSIAYNHTGVRNPTWRVSDSHMHSDHQSGGFLVEVEHDSQALAFKLRWL